MIRKNTLKEYLTLCYANWIFNQIKINWALLVRQLLSRLGFMYVWIAQRVGSIAIFINVFKQRVKARLENSSRARFYNQISSFNYQVYLDKLQVG